MALNSPIKTELIEQECMDYKEGTRKDNNHCVSSVIIAPLGGYG